MAAVAKNPKFSPKRSVFSQKVREDFLEADKGRKFSRGGRNERIEEDDGKGSVFHEEEGVFEVDD